jgi:outer membrane lipoprotein carrier protein
MQALLLLFSFLNSAFPASPDTDTRAIVQRLEAAYRPARTLQATFLERYSEGGRTTRAESGIVYFRRPGKMRFDYEAPEKNLFLVDGKYAWFYVPADHTVTRVPAKESGDWRTPLALLAGEMKVSRVCAKVQLATNEQPENPANVLLHCSLRGAKQDSSQAQASPNPQLQGSRDGDSVFFEVARTTGELARVLVRQAGGIEVEFRFTHWQFDPPIADSQFRFTPPLGVAIVNGELPSQSTSVK